MFSDFAYSFISHHPEGGEGKDLAIGGKGGKDFITRIQSYSSTSLRGGHDVCVILLTGEGRVLGGWPVNLGRS